MAGKPRIEFAGVGIGGHNTNFAWCLKIVICPQNLSKRMPDTQVAPQDAGARAAHPDRWAATKNENQGEESWNG